MAISSVNPFTIGNIERGYGVSTYQPVKPVDNTDNTNKAEGFKGFASIEDIEKASQFLAGNIDSPTKVPESNQTAATEPKGSLFEGFDISGWSGTPIYQEGEKIYDYLA